MNDEQLKSIGSGRVFWRGKKNEVAVGRDDVQDVA